MVLLGFASLIALDRFLQPSEPIKVKSREEIIKEEQEEVCTAAKILVKEQVSKKLKEPAQAQWPPALDVACVTEGGIKYQVTGSVLVPNAFGALQTITYKAIMIYQGGDPIEDSSWHWVSVEVSE